MIPAQTIHVGREGKPVPTLRRRGPLGPDHATSYPTLHPGLTKPRRYDGEVGAVDGARFGNIFFSPNARLPASTAAHESSAGGESDMPGSVDASAYDPGTDLAARRFRGSITSPSI
jgi:hypothetical protein